VFPPLLEPLIEKLARRIADAFSRPLDALREESPHARTSADDARIHLDAWVQHKPVQFGVLAAAAGGAAAILVPAELSFPWNALLAAAAAGLAAAAAPAFAFVYFWITAPARQRDEARAALAQRPRLKAKPKRPERPPVNPDRVVKLLAERRDERLRAEIQDELVAIIDQGRAVNKNAFDEPGYGPFRHWQDNAARFIETVLGPLEAQRFREAYDPAPLSFSETVEHRLKRLASLRDRPDTWSPQVSSSDLRDACELRRHVSEADLIVLAGDPGGAAQVPQRLDRAGLAADLRDLSAALEGAIEGQRDSEERGIAAVRERARQSAPAQPQDVVQELAESTVAAETRKVVLREFGEKLGDLIDAAVDLGAIPRPERNQYVEPDGDNFKRLPASLNRTAERIDAFQADV
jgi:hypothetical protein